VDRSRLDARTVTLALLCVAVLAFAAATLDTTTDPGSAIGFGGGPGDQRGFEGTPTPDDPGSSDEGRSSVIDLDGGTATVCVEWLTRPLVRAGLVLGLVGLLLAGRWYDDEVLGLTLAFVVGYPGLFVYLLLTACRSGSPGLVPDLSQVGSPVSEESGGLLGGQGTATSPTVATQLLLVLVVVLLGAVAVIVLTGDYEQGAATGGDRPADDETAARVRPDVGAVGEAAGRAADRIEADGEFENEVYRAWAEMTDPLSVERPESSTPGEFAEAAVAAGLDPDDVDRLTGLFAEVRYGGADPTPERERAAVETLRHVEATYADGGDGA
jgi:hypothetical protein